MFDKSLEYVLSMVERAFVRLQAGDVLANCLEEESTAPLQELVERLVLAGPTSLNALREIRAEVIAQRAELQNEIARIFSNTEEKLISWGVNLDNLSGRTPMHSLETASLGIILRQVDGQDEARLQEYARLLSSTKESMLRLARQILLLNEVDIYLGDWIWGLMYQSAREMEGEGGVLGQKNTHWH